jgi:polysaccharide biosynthesis/export protein
LVVCSTAIACAENRPYVWAADLPASADNEPVIREGDHVYLIVKGQDALTGELPVRADGTVVHPVFGKIRIAGMTELDAARVVKDGLRNIVVDPVVSVALATASPYRVSVVGEVTKPGPFEVDRGEGVLQALGRAGGFTEFASKDGIYVLREKPSATRVRFRYADLVGGDERSLKFRLRDGDVVVVE